MKIKYLTLILIIYSSCKELPAPVSYSGFYISVDTAYKYRELIKFYFNVEFPWIVDTVKPKVKTFYNSDGKLEKAKSNKKNKYSTVRIVDLNDTVNPKVFYGIAGIKKQPIDSSKYFYRRFLAERKKGVPDSLNKFKSKLYKK